MPRSSNWFFIVLLAVVGLGVMKAGGFLRGVGGPGGLVRALGSVPEPRPENPARQAQAPVDPSTGPLVSNEPWPTVTYTADETKDPLTNLLLVKKAPPATPATPLPDPSKNAPPAAAPSPAIQGLMWGGARPQAVIDGEVYTIGDTVQGATIVAIDRAGITGEFQGRQIRWTFESPGK